MSVDPTPDYTLVPPGTVRETLVAPHLIGEQNPLMAEIKTEVILGVAEANRRPGLLTPSAGYKPFRYPWAYDMWKVHEQVHWMPDEVPLADDIADWSRFSPAKQNFYTQIFRLFTKSDQVVADNYNTRLSSLFKPTEINMMLSGFAARENIHIDGYSSVLETIGMPDTEYEAFAEYEAMANKVDHWNSFKVDTDADILRTLAMFGGFAEGLQVFASFAMLMNGPRHGEMKNMGQIVSWSVRDETLHCDGIIKLYHTFAEESGALTNVVKDDIMQTCETVVGLEDKFIDLAFEMGEQEDLTPDDVKRYIRFIANWRLHQLGLPNLFPGPGVGSPNPLPWLQPLLSAQEHSNFFEARATGYAKAASRGSYRDVWDRFDAGLR